MQDLLLMEVGHGVRTEEDAYSSLLMKAVNYLRTRTEYHVFHPSYESQFLRVNDC